jgi:hypothetical protein
MLIASATAGGVDAGLGYLAQTITGIAASRPVRVCSTRAQTSRHGAASADTPGHESWSDVGFWGTGRHVAASRGTAEWVYKTNGPK